MQKQPGKTFVALCLFAFCTAVYAGEDMKVLREILLEKGIITQEEFDKKIKAAQGKDEIRAFNEAQAMRRASRDIDKRAEDERKFKTQIYGQVSAGTYQDSTMTADNLDASGLTYSSYKEWDFCIDYARAMRETGATGAFTIFDKWKPDTGSTSRTGFSESTRSQAGVSIGAQYKF